MEQSGKLLTDAVELYALKRWSSSLVLAVFSLEELGKAEVLLNRAIDASAHGPKTAEEVMAGLDRHATKLKSGRGRITVSACVGFWGDVPEPNGEEMAELLRRLEDANQRALEHAPRADHQARMRALYVDLAEYDLWSRPVETSMNDAYLMVAAASIEYDVRKGKFTNPVDPAVRQVVRDLGDLLPTLPDAPQVDWPVE